MEGLQRAVNDLKGMINAFRVEVDAMAGTLLTTKGGMSPEELQHNLYTLQERIRQAAKEKYARVLEEAAQAEAELLAELQRVKELREQALRTSSILNALTGTHQKIEVKIGAEID
jgi:hypothetical protein